MIMNLLRICQEFRAAIEDIRMEGGFFIGDRMHRFPVGCCDDTCDLLAFYLKEEYDIETRQLVKTYEPDEPELRCNHAVLLLDDNRIIDLTGDQFPGGTKVYVGKEDDFYQSMEFFNVIDNYDIRGQERLLNDYIAIKTKLKK